MKREVEEADEAEDRPKRRKKKKSSANQKTNQKWIPYLIFGSIGACAIMLLLGVVIIAVVWSRSSGGKLTTPAEYVTYNSNEDVFHIDLPKDWKIEGGGKKNYTSVSARKGTASIEVSEGLIGSLIGDIAGARNEPNPTDENLPVSRVHDFKRRLFEEEYGKYQEQDTVMIRNGFGKTRRSAFTGTIAGIRKTRGYRSTSLGVLTQIGVVCQCSPGDWDTVEPAFARAIETLGSGRKEP